MKKFSQDLKNMWQDESAQGATEYIILMVVIVGLVLAFKGQIQEIVNNKIGELGNSISSVTSQ